MPKSMLLILLPGGYFFNSRVVKEYLTLASYVSGLQLVILLILILFLNVLSFKSKAGCIFF
jgi:hypothetical protein